ncbi:hypothetical protein [Corynebacterium sp.]|uniref:hypothetical protein n=1 Tax=Corynebacterium sp. TaxID=1720 RepID=UPI0028AE0E08|nr:hypothetical protein [Corynebacterium sp.]
MAPKLKNYRIKVGNMVLTVKLSEETKKRVYPDAVEVTPEKAKTPAPKKQAANKAGSKDETKEDKNEESKSDNSESKDEDTK